MKVERRNSYKLDIPRTDDDAITARGFGEAIVIALSSMARTDNVLTVEEYQSLTYAVDYLAELSQHPPLFRVLALQSLFSSTSFDTAIKDVRKFAKDQDEKARLAVITGVVPLLLCQGQHASKFARAWGSALNITTEVTDKVLSNLPQEGETGFFKIISSVWKSNQSYLTTVKHFATTFRDDNLFKVANEAEKSWPAKKARDKINKELKAACKRVLNKVKVNLPNLKELEPQELAAKKFWGITETLVEQIEQRLYFVSQRLQLQRDIFQDDINNFIETTSDLIEVGMQDLMKGRTYTWADKSIWDKFASTDAAHRVLSRYQPLQNRYKKIFDLWNRELEEFSKELLSTVKYVLDNVDPVAFSTLVKTDHQSVEIRNKIDQTADITLGASVLAVLGGVALIAMGYLPAAAIAGAAGFIISNPVGWVIGGAIGLSMLWKIVSSPTDRQIKFVKDKREQFREELMKLLGNPERDHDKLCEDVEKQFYDIASKYFAPLVRDARLSIMQPALEARAIRRVQEDTKAACKKILSMQMTD